jgi:voltage-gated potassium channel
MLVAVFGIAAFAVVATSIIQSLVVERMNRVMGLTKVYSKNHIVICGWNETTRAAIRELLISTKKQVVVIDNKIDKLPLDHHRVDFLKGDYRSTEILEKAGVKKASDVIVASGKDSDTILTVLEVRRMNKDVHITAEAREAEVDRLIKQAGANEVISSLSFGGRLLAASVSQPGTTYIMEDISATGVGSELSEIELPKRLTGKSFGDLVIELKKDSNVMPLAIRRGGRILINPGLEEKIRDGDALIVLCKLEELRGYKKKLK